MTQITITLTANPCGCVDTTAKVVGINIPVREKQAALDIMEFVKKRMSPETGRCAHGESKVREFQMIRELPNG